MPFAKVTDRYTSEQIKRFYTSGVWRETTLPDELDIQAAAHPDKMFVTDSTTSYTFSQLRDAARRLAAGLEPLRTLPAGGYQDTRALEFTGAEASALFSAYLERQPSSWELTVLLEATQGWATALVLAASSQLTVRGLAEDGSELDRITLAR